MSRPSNRTVPPVGSSRRMITRASVDFPQPDSPTIPSVSPRRTWSETPSSALTEATSCLNTIPSVIGKYFTTFWVSSRTSVMSPSGVRLQSDTCSRSRRLLVQPELGDDARGLLELADLGQEARIEMPSVEARRRRLGKLAPAAVERIRTARAEAAARGRPQEGRR